MREHVQHADGRENSAHLKTRKEKERKGKERRKENKKKEKKKGHGKGKERKERKTEEREKERTRKRKRKGKREVISLQSAQLMRPFSALSFHCCITSPHSALPSPIENKKKRKKGNNRHVIDLEEDSRT